MSDLTLPDIDAICAQARAMGLSPAAVQGVRAMLLMRAAKPSGADKLKMALRMLPQAQREGTELFLSDIESIGADVLSRSRTELEALSDDEWERMINGG